MQFSVVVPAYNVEKYIADCIESVLRQTFAEFELIIVDDASTDLTADVVKTFDDKRIKFIQNSENRGVSYTRNVAIRESTGSYIVLLDSDDVFRPDRLNVFNDYIVTESPDLLFDDLYYLAEGSAVPHETAYERRRIPVGSVDRLRINDYIEKDLGILQGAFKRTFAVTNQIFYDDDHGLGEDFIFYLDFFFKGAKVRFIPEALYVYRQRSGSLITSVDARYFDSLIKTTEVVLERYSAALEVDSDIQRLLETRLRAQSLAFSHHLAMSALKRGDWPSALSQVRRDRRLAAALARTAIRKFGSEPRRRG